MANQEIGCKKRKTQAKFFDKGHEKTPDNRDECVHS